MFKKLKTLKNEKYTSHFTVYYQCKVKTFDGVKDNVVKMTFYGNSKRDVKKWIHHLNKQARNCDDTLYYGYKLLTVIKECDIYV